MHDQTIPPRAVIFDLDGLLIDSEPLQGEAYVGLFRELGLKASIEEFRRLVTMQGIRIRDYHSRLGGDSSKWPEILLEKAVRYRALVAEKGRPMPGAIALLNLLNAERIPTAICTSSNHRSLSAVVDHLGLAPYFREFISQEQMKAEKPDPDGYLVAARAFGVSPEACVALEDSPKGIAAAIDAGMKCIAVPNAFTADGDFSRATRVMKSLEEVDLAVLRGLF